MSLDQVVQELDQVVQELNTLNTKSNTVLDKANSVLDKVNPILDTSSSALSSLQRIEKLLTIGLFILLGIIFLGFVVYVVSKYATVRHVIKGSSLGGRNTGVEMTTLK